MIIVTETGDRYKLRVGQNRIGRGIDCDLQVDSSDVSRHHAMISWKGDKAQIMDLGSTNGTKVNGNQLVAYEYAPMNAGDKIQLGHIEETSARLSVELEGGAAGESTAASTVVMNVEDILSKVKEEQVVTAEMVGSAYAALGSGDMEQIKKYWDEEVAWLIPGHNPLSGWYRGLDAFIDYMRQVRYLTGNNFNTQSLALMVGGDHSADVSRYIGYRAGFDENSGEKPYTKLDVEVVHVLRWRNGKIFEGRSAIYGDGTNEYDQFWSPFVSDGERLN